jgi:hypothetical protein
VRATPPSLTSGQVADRLGVSLRQVQLLIQTDKLPARRRADGTWEVAPAAVEAELARRAAGERRRGRRWPKPLAN